MRILYSHYHTDQNHPAVQMVESIAKELRFRGHEVLVHACAGIKHGKAIAKPERKQNRQTIKTTLKQGLWFAKAMSRNRIWLASDRKHMQDFKPDVVLARQDAYCWSAHQAARSFGIPIVTYADAPVAYESREFNHEKRWHPPGILESIERWTLRHSRAAITVSHPAANQLARYRLSTPVHVIHNGIDLLKFTEAAKQVGQDRRYQLGLNDKTVIGFQGTFKPFHGIDRLRELIEWTNREESKVHWLLIGDGPERGTLEQSLTRYDNVTFLGRQPREAMSGWLAALDIAVAPHAQMDGDFYFCPLKILEYAASGSAILASDQGDIPLLLANGTGGEIVRNNNLQPWIDGLSRLIDNPLYRQEIATVAREHVLTNLTWAQTAARVNHVLCESIGERFEEPCESVGFPMPDYAADPFNGVAQHV